MINVDSIGASDTRCQVGDGVPPHVDAGIINHRTTVNGEAVSRQIWRRGNRNIGARTRNIDVLTIYELDGGIGCNVCRCIAVGLHVPTSIGNIANACQLLLCRCLATSVSGVRVEGGVGQTTDRAGITVDRDRIGRPHTEHVR